MLSQLDHDQLNLQTERSLHQQREQLDTMQKLIQLTARLGDSQKRSYALMWADALVALNYLNLALEPSFSFKGAPGLLHLLIFEAGSRNGLNVGSAADQIQRNKWKLFNSYSKEERDQ